MTRLGTRPEQIVTGVAFLIGLLILAGYGLILLVQHAIVG